MSDMMETAERLFAVVFGMLFAMTIYSSNLRKTRDRVIVVLEQAWNLITCLEAALLGT